MITTVQARSIMRSAGAYSNRIYTNKLADPTLRSVKCYYDEVKDAPALISALEKLGATVKVTPGDSYMYSAGPGITVKCLAQ